MPDQTSLVPARDLVATPPQSDDPYAHLRAIIAKSRDPHAVKAAQTHIERLTGKASQQQKTAAEPAATSRTPLPRP